jgi:hypothetical protein
MLINMFLIYAPIWLIESDAQYICPYGSTSVPDSGEGLTYVATNPSIVGKLKRSDIPVI